MFTLEQIKTAHRKVKSGMDFPAYIQDIKELGVISYETFVNDGHTNYYGAVDHQISSPAKYNPLLIADISDGDQFKTDLKAHQQGKTNYPVFCSDCARSGIEKWLVSIEQMTCIYYDKNGKKILVEKIPE